MSDPDVANALARDDDRIVALRREIRVLETILQEIRHLYFVTTDFETAGDIRHRDAEVSEQIDVLRMRLSRARASGVIKPRTKAEQRRQIKALEKLDRYIRNDQQIQQSITYLMQIAACFT